MDLYLSEMFGLNVEPNIDPYEFIQEEFDFIAFVEAETAAGVPKKSLLEKLINLIMKAANAIVNIISKVVKWWRKLFRKQKEPRTVDQILDDLGCPRSEMAKDPNRKTQWDRAKNASDLFKNIDMMTKPLTVSMENDAETFIFTAKDYWMNTAFISRQNGVTNSHPSLHDPRAFMIAMKFISRPQLMRELNMIADHISQGKYDVDTEQLINDIYANAITDVNVTLKYRITLSQIQEFNKQMLSINKRLAVMDDTTVAIGSNDQQVVRGLNRLFNAVLNLQIGSTLIGSCIRNVYIIDPEFCETIRDPNVLGEFANKMLNCGVPEKYLAFNCWMGAHPDVKGNATSEDPVWGMSRLTFIPKTPDTVVYKIAINGWGIRSNISEKKISDAVYAHGVGERFAKIIAIHPSMSMVTMERAKIDKAKSAKYVDEVIAEMSKALAAAGIPGKIGDCTADNIGFRGDVAINIDYGMVGRTPNPVTSNGTMMMAATA